MNICWFLKGILSIISTERERERERERESNKNQHTGNTYLPRTEHLAAVSPVAVEVDKVTVVTAVAVVVAAEESIEVSY